MKKYILLFILIQFGATVRSQQDAMINFGQINADSILSKINLSETRIVVLGEQEHGVEEYLQLNQQLIKNLVEKYNFTTLIIESDFFSLHNYQSTLGNKISENIHSIFSNSKAFQPVLQLVENNKLKISGFDSRHHGSISKSYLTEYLKSEFEKLSINVEPQFYQLSKEIVEKEFEIDWNNKIFEDYLSAIELKLSEVKDTNLFVFRELLNLKNYVSQLKTEKHSVQEYVEARESAMIENIKWLLKQTIDEKIIVLGHNNHVQKGIKSLINSKYLNIGDYIDSLYGYETITILPITHRARGGRKTVPFYLKKKNNNFVLIDLNKLNPNSKIYKRKDKNFPSIYGDYLFYIREKTPSIVID